MSVIVPIRNVAIARNLVISLANVLYSPHSVPTLLPFRSVRMSFSFPPLQWLSFPSLSCCERDVFSQLSADRHLMICNSVLTIGTTQSQKRGMQELFPDGTFRA